MSFFSFCCFGREIWFLERKIWWWTSSSSLLLLSSFIFFKCFLKKQQQQQQIDVDIIFMKKERILLFLHFDNNKERNEFLNLFFACLIFCCWMKEFIVTTNLWIYPIMILDWKWKWKTTRNPKNQKREKKRNFRLFLWIFHPAKKKTKLTNQFSLAVECHSHQTNYYYEKNKTKQNNEIEWFVNILWTIQPKIKPTEKQIFFIYRINRILDHPDHHHRQQNRRFIHSVNERIMWAMSKRERERERERINEWNIFIINKLKDDDEFVLSGRKSTIINQYYKWNWLNTFIDSLYNTGKKKNILSFSKHLHTHTHKTQKMKNYSFPFLFDYCHSVCVCVCVCIINSQSEWWKKRCLWRFLSLFVWFLFVLFRLCVQTSIVNRHRPKIVQAGMTVFDSVVVVWLVVIKKKRILNQERILIFDFCCCCCPSMFFFLDDDKWQQQQTNKQKFDPVFFCLSNFF